MAGFPPAVDPLATLATVAGPDTVRPASGSDAVDTVFPRWVVEPPSGAAVAAALEWAARAAQSVVVRGGGTKLDWGRPATAVDLVVGTNRLDRVRAHAHGDLTATVEAGVSLLALNRELARHGQWLPLESAFPGATVGGTLATNDAGPLRHRYGAPRDQVIGVELATTDGRLVKAGGTVVKNVAGYDLGRLLAGSWGNYAVIVSATFKLAPLPQGFRTVCFTLPEADLAPAAAAALADSQLEEAAVDLRFERPARGRRGLAQVLVRFASAPAVAEAHAFEVQRRLRTIGVEIAEHSTGAAEADVWQLHRGRPWHAQGAVLRAFWPPARLDAMLALLRELSSEAAATLIGRVGLGNGLLRLEGDLPALAAAGATLAAHPGVVQVVALRGPAELKVAVASVPDPHLAALVGRLKKAFDAPGVLGAGRAPS